MFNSAFGQEFGIQTNSESHYLRDTNGAAQQKFSSIKRTRCSLRFVNFSITFSLKVASIEK